MPRVLITREPFQSAGIIKKLAEHGVTGICFPVTEIKIIAPNTKIPNPNNFRSILFTSARAVKITAELFTSTDMSLPGNLMIMAVGKRTMEVVGEQFGRLPEIVGHEGGETLGRQIIEQYGQDASPILWPSARETASNLQDDLSKQGIMVEKWPIYETIPLDLKKLEIDFAEKGDFDALFLAAPTAVVSLSRIERITNKPGIAIGKTTARSMIDHGWKTIITAKTPSVDDCVNAILSVTSFKRVN